MYRCDTPTPEDARELHQGMPWRGTFCSTAAQKAGLQSHLPGRPLGFHRAVQSIAKYEEAEVARVAPNGLVVHNAHGRESTASRKQAGSFDILEARPVEVSPGDRLLLTADKTGIRDLCVALVTS